MLHQSLDLFPEVDMRQIIYNSGHILKRIENIKYKWRLQNPYHLTTKEFVTHQGVTFILLKFDETINAIYFKVLQQKCLKGKMLNSLWPRDDIWHHMSLSTLVQVMASCLTAPSRNQNQCWRFITMVLWHSSEDNSTENVQDIYHFDCVWRLSI